MSIFGSKCNKANISGFSEATLKNKCDELGGKYFNIAKERINNATKQGRLFNEEE